MSDRQQARDIEPLIAEIDRQLKLFGQTHNDLPLREKVLKLVELRNTIGDLGVAVSVADGIDAHSAIERIRLYFLQHVGTAISGDELAVVSGITDYPRRIRQLRTEAGYRILSGLTSDADSGLDMNPSEYMLMTETPDSDAARRWLIANRIRRSKVGSMQRVLLFLMENLKQVVTTEDLAYVARGAREFARRVRQLRTEEGYAIVTRFTGRPDLGAGEYMLLSPNRVSEPHDRHIPLETQKLVYSRDNNKCRLCGWTVDFPDPRILELHHLKPHLEHGENIAENLIVVCSKCHDDIHAGRKSIDSLL